MYSVPDDFQSQLDNAFHGRFRVRWSYKRAEFQLEQKVGTGQVLLPPPIDPDAISPYYDTYSDEWIRARDGYFLVMSLRNGDRMPCPICGLEVRVPIRETKESHCDYCRSHGRDGRYVAAFYPLNHLLIEKIQDLDPLNGGIGRARRRMLDKRGVAQKAELKQNLDQADYIVTSDSRNQIEGNPHSGYGQKSRGNIGEPRI